MRDLRRVVVGGTGEAGSCCSRLRTAAALCVGEHASATVSQAAPPGTGRHCHDLQSCSRGGSNPLSIRSQSTLSPTFQDRPFGSANISPPSLFRVAVPCVASMLVMVATTPVV